MRLWTVHPKYLDRQGILAVWREALLAQKVLLGQTTGYRHHPQLERFKKHNDPPAAIGFYLTELHKEAARRGYRFNEEKIISRKKPRRIAETEGQLRFEWHHLQAKLRHRGGRANPSPDKDPLPDPHPLFRIVPGEMRPWERGTPPS